MVGYTDRAPDYVGPIVLVVHCVDTEGPIGGDVRRHSDGTPEFMDRWTLIRQSLQDITTDEFRFSAVDSFGRPYRYNWFIMDFIGFTTNPKCRIDAYNDTYDNIRVLNTDVDSFHWHYHQPPRSGIGDEWSDDWDSSNEHYAILGNRLMYRNTFPSAFRAGGTIEDEKCSKWLEDHFMVDYSNRVTAAAKPWKSISDFNWYGAPSAWGYYHPSVDRLTVPGNMRRYIVRSIDAQSRFNRLSAYDVEQAFAYAKMTGGPIIMSYFSHDHRDMRQETREAIRLVKAASERYRVKYAWCDAVRALQIADVKNLESRVVRLEKRRKSLDQIEVSFSDDIYQRNPFVYTLDANGTITYRRYELQKLSQHRLMCIDLYDDIAKIGVACHSMSGELAMEVFDPWSL